MRTETRLIIYTNDAILLSLADFPLYVLKIDLTSKSQKAIAIIERGQNYVMTSSIIHKIRTIETKGANSIEKMLYQMPPGFTPKIETLFCMDDEARVLNFKRVTLHPRFIIDSSHLEVIEMINKVWLEGCCIYAQVVKDDRSNPRVKEYIPKHLRPSLLLLDTVDGDVDLAQDVKTLWDVWDQIIKGGNEYARTPISNLVERTEVRKRIWEYSPYKEAP